MDGTVGNSMVVVLCLLSGLITMGATMTGDQNGRVS